MASSPTDSLVYQQERPLAVTRYNTRFAKDPRYSGWQSLLKSGDYYNANFGYHVVPFEYDKFDIETFEKNPLEFTVVCTDVETGQPVYHKMDHVDYNELEWLRASASMPLASKVVEVDGWKLLDGGVADSIPLEYYEKQGYKRNVVILTQPLGYRKTHLGLMPLMRLVLRKYPHFLKALDERHLMYNCQLDYVAEAERLGRCLVIRPDEDIPIGHLSHDPQQMRLVYDMGRKVYYYRTARDAGGLRTRIDTGTCREERTGRDTSAQPARLHAGQVVASRRRLPLWWLSRHGDAV